MVFDTIVEDMPEIYSNDRPWGRGNNPKTAVWEFLKNYMTPVRATGIPDEKRGSFSYERVIGLSLIEESKINC